MSFVGGYPVGAKTIASLVREKKLSQETAARMLCFSVNAGPSFLIGTVGVALLGSPRLGWILLFAQIASAFLIGGIVSRRAKISRGETGGVGLPFSAAFVEAGQRGRFRDVRPVRLHHRLFWDIGPFALQRGLERNRLPAGQNRPLLPCGPQPF